MLTEPTADAFWVVESIDPERFGHAGSMDG